MGKTSKYPSYSTGAVEINGNTVATSGKKKNTVTSSYNMNDTEKSIYDGIQNNLNTSLSNLFDISDSTKDQWTKQLDAYKKTGIENINDIYDPIETNLKNDIASRFGNFDNSIFMDNLNEITDKKAKAISDLSDSLTMKQTELYSTELANRMSYVSLLSGLNTTMNNNILGYMQAAMANSNSGNSYNQAAYQASQQSSFATNLNAISNFGRMVSSYLPQNKAANTAISMIDNGTRYA